jgi:signal transduction histidine kinase
MSVFSDGATTRIHILEAQKPKLLSMLACGELVISSLIRGDQVLRLASDNQLSEQDLDAFLADVVESAVTIASATGGAIALLDDEHSDDALLCDQSVDVQKNERLASKIEAGSSITAPQDRGGCESGNETAKLSSVISPASSASMPAAERKFCERYNRRFPIRTWTQLRGWLELSFDKEIAPSSHTLIALPALADQIALTLKFCRSRTKTPEAVSSQQAAAERERIFEQIGNAGREALRKLTERPKLDAYLEYVITVASDQFAADGASVWLHDHDTETVHLASRVDSPALQARRLRPKGNNRSFRYHNGVLAKLAGRQILTFKAPDFSGIDPIDLPDVLAQGLKTIIAVPMFVGTEYRGSLVFAFQHARELTVEEEQLAHALADQASLALELTRLADQVKTSAVHDERARIAHEIHDTLAQCFVGILLQLEASEELLQSAPHLSATCLKRVEELARRGLQEARSSVLSITGDGARYRDLSAVLEETVARYKERSSSAIHLEINGEIFPLPAEWGLNMARVCQEALANIERHASASNVTVTLTYDHPMVTVRVVDDGVGFQPDKVGDSGYGLLGLRQRANRIHADLEISSQPGKGTSITLRARVDENVTGFRYSSEAENTPRL